MHTTYRRRILPLKEIVRVRGMDLRGFSVSCQALPVLQLGTRAHVRMWQHCATVGEHMRPETLWARANPVDNKRGGRKWRTLRPAVASGAVQRLFETFVFCSLPTTTCLFAVVHSDDGQFDEKGAPSVDKISWEFVRMRGVIDVEIIGNIHWLADRTTTSPKNQTNHVVSSHSPFSTI